jgi:hypothetical protein
LPVACCLLPDFCKKSNVDGVDFFISRKGAKAQRIVPREWSKLNTRNGTNIKEVNTMTVVNVKLVKTLAEIIRSFSEEEKSLLETELHAPSNWEITKERILQRGKAIEQRLAGNPLTPSIDDIFYQMREERSEQLMQASRTNFDKNNQGAGSLRPYNWTN